MTTAPPVKAESTGSGWTVREAPVRARRSGWKHVYAVPLSMIAIVLTAAMLQEAAANDKALSAGLGILLFAFGLGTVIVRSRVQPLVGKLLGSILGTDRKV